MNFVFCCTQKEAFPIPRSHEHNTAQLGRAFGASAEICQIQQGIWERQAFHFGDFYENHPMSVPSVQSTSHSTPGRTTTPEIVSEWPCAIRQPKSYFEKYLHTSKRNPNSSCFNDLFPKSVMILPFLSKCFLDSVPSWLSFIVKSCFWFLSLIFHSHS